MHSSKLLTSSRALRDNPDGGRAGQRAINMMEGRLKLEGSQEQRFRLRQEIQGLDHCDEVTEATG